ncbi:hypothetical protein EC973_000359 [Apophysomyces ossiformis]|uniref:Uncharacterized protein n=1 Tax=Apophysomyces ossiformis TaxID=679940 RepID=A0A8H7BRT2_9FUNG|nr:hypothetical protein EC973_000359 [Apophysomyces ossiformis]
MVFKKLLNKVHHRLAGDTHEPFYQRGFCRRRWNDSLKETAGSASLSFIPSHSLNSTIPTSERTLVSAESTPRFPTRRPFSFPEEEEQAVVIPEILEALRACGTSINLSISSESTMQNIVFQSDTASERSTDDNDSFLEAVLRSYERASLRSQSAYQGPYSTDLTPQNRKDTDSSFSERFSYPFSECSLTKPNPSVAPPSPPESPDCAPSRNGMRDKVVKQVKKTMLEMELASAWQRLESALKENQQLKDRLQTLEKNQTTSVADRSPPEAQCQQDELMRMHTRAQLSLIEYLEGESDMAGAMARFKRQLEYEEAKKDGLTDFPSHLANMAKSVVTEAFT